MKILTLGIVLAIIGIVMLFVKEFDFVTSEKVVDMGAVQVTKETNHPVKWSSVAGMGFLGIGGLLIFAGAWKKGSSRVGRD